MNVVLENLPVPSATGKIIRNHRIHSIDMLRGLVMIVMALDHTRDYLHYSVFYFSPEDLAHTSGHLFFTRWITHFCAPVFVFLAGTSAYLYGNNKSRKELSRFLLTRGLWLILLEITVLRFFWFFNPAYPYFNLQVIWAIGISMLALSALIYAHRTVILVVALVLIFGHNLLDGIHIPGNNAGAMVWSFLHEPKHFKSGRLDIYFHYPVLPWIGIMTLGFYFGRLYTAGIKAGQRKRILLMLGILSCGLFMLLRAGNLYGDASPWSMQRNAILSVVSFFNVTKYPPSLLYILMTLGPALILLALLERPLKSWSNVLLVYGRVPFVYYMAHVLLIHMVAMVVAVATGHDWRIMVFSGSISSTTSLKGFGLNLATVYLCWILIVGALYPLCKWYGQYKQAHIKTNKWLSYL